MKPFVTAALSALLATQLSAQEAAQNPLVESDYWTQMRDSFVGDAEVADGSAVFEVEAPYRAADAATVPIEIRQVDDSAKIASAMVVIDENPAPVAAEMTFGEAMAPLDMELRVRVNQYSNVRVIAETEDGATLMNGRYVKASGGCSAPATSDPEAALADMGEMRLKLFDAAGGAQMSVPRREAQIMIRHPNYSGLQRDQITQLFVPAHFIDTIEVWQGDEMLWTLTGGISISEDPVFRFGYDDNGSTDLTVKATDTEGNTFEHTFSKSQES